MEQSKEDIKDSSYFAINISRLQKLPFSGIRKIWRYCSRTTSHNSQNAMVGKNQKHKAEITVGIWQGGRPRASVSGRIETFRMPELWNQKAKKPLQKLLQFLAQPVRGGCFLIIENDEVVECLISNLLKDQRDHGRQRLYTIFKLGRLWHMVILPYLVLFKKNLTLNLRSAQTQMQIQLSGTQTLPHTQRGSQHSTVKGLILWELRPSCLLFQSQAKRTGEINNVKVSVSS